MKIYKEYTDAVTIARSDAGIYRSPQIVVSQAGAHTRTGWQYAVLAAERGVPYGWSLLDTYGP